MAKSLAITWVLPTTRASGKPLLPKDIKNVRIEMSADGVNFGVFGSYPPDVLTTTVTDLEPGIWSFKGYVVDLANRESAPLSAMFEITDETPPSPLAQLSVALA
jgi:hypothetical protein